MKGISRFTISMFLMIVISILVCSCITVTATEPANQKSVEESQLARWTGTWDTNWGTMHLSQSAGKITGSYEHDGGKITGNIAKNLDGNVLVGKWSEKPSYSPPQDAGDFEWTISDDLNSFSGKWRYGSSGDWSGDWEATRVN